MTRYTEDEIRTAVASIWPRTSPAAGWMPDRIIESLRYSRERAAGEVTQ